MAYAALDGNALPEQPEAEGLKRKAPQGYGALPAWALERICGQGKRWARAQLGAYAALVTCRNSTTGNSQPSAATIAEMIRMSRGTVQQALRDLRALGVIFEVGQTRMAGGKLGAKIYHLPLSDPSGEPQKPTPSARVSEVGSARVSHTDSARVWGSALNKEKQRNKADQRSGQEACAACDDTGWQKPAEVVGPSAGLQPCPQCSLGQARQTYLRSQAQLIEDLPATGADLPEARQTAATIAALRESLQHRSRA